MKSLLLSILILFSVSVHAQEITLSGTMHRTTLEGGCWYLKSDGGKSFELTGDTGILRQIRVDGQHVMVRGIPAKRSASICMIGEIIRVTARIDSIRAPFDPVITAILIEGKVHRTTSGVWYVKIKSGLRYEFRKPVGKQYCHLGLKIHQKFRVLLDGRSNPDNMNGEILPDSGNPTLQ